MAIYEWDAPVEAGRARYVLLRYVDAEGDPSERRILPLSLSGNFNGDGTLDFLLVSAMCMKARARRSFRFDRIQELAYADTGEIIDDLQQWASYLAHTETVEHKENPQPLRDKSQTTGNGWRTVASILAVAILIMVIKDCGGIQPLGDASSRSAGPSFDCTGVRGEIANMICGDAELSALDVSLANAYASALERAGGRRQRRKIRSDENAWIKQRSLCENRDCVQQAFETRISELTQ